MCLIFMGYVHGGGPHGTLMGLEMFVSGLTIKRLEGQNQRLGGVVQAEPGGLGCCFSSSLMRSSRVGHSSFVTGLGLLEDHPVRELVEELLALLDPLGPCSSGPGRRGLRAGLAGSPG
jgi:hypothetical protein